MNDEITFIGDRWGEVVSLVFAAAVGALGVWVLLFDVPLLGAFILLVAAVPVVVALPIVISPQSTYLRLDSKGFEVGSRSDKARVKWDDVAAFRWGTFNDRPVIEIQYSNSGQEPVLRRIFDRYNASLSDILSELVDWRSRFGPDRKPIGSSMSQ